jgi:hypothetical protein
VHPQGRPEEWVHLHVQQLNSFWSQAGKLCGYDQSDPGIRKIPSPGELIVVVQYFLAREGMNGNMMQDPKPKF